MEQRPLILVVNDDGYEAKGLEAMVEIAKCFGEVVVVAPDRSRSAMGHAITMDTPLRVQRYKVNDGVEYWRSNGTPVDCVKLGMKVVLQNRKVDLVLSGINHGSNSSISIIYSGTMGAAIEASFDTKSVGISLLDYSADADFTAAIHFGKQIVAAVLKQGLPKQVSLNVNVPKVSIAEIKGMRVVCQARGIWHEDMVPEVDPFGRTHYWYKGYLENEDPRENTCEWALSHNYISIMPVQYDMTAYNVMDNIKFLEDVR